ncbi:L-selectin-like [Eriocheir sinensis]|uniref:L-selectin-like n=1 Tax=Eriocheir sinensis TaxID=95602 RepID=UPI0021C6DA1C|nr:L-selectin-like [Eriocheir sinensis]
MILHQQMKFVVLLLLVGVAACVPQRGGFFDLPGFSRNRGRPQFNRPPQQFNRGGGFRDDGGNRGGQVHHSEGGIDYNYSWRNGQSQLTGGGAESYCRGLGGGWAAVTIDSPAKNSFIYGLIRNERLQYIWTGARKSGRGFTWANGSPLDFADWSHTGGRGRPQPDNREGNEDCLAVLDNIYNDGLKWHDVACSHRKPTVCERRS